ncbi:MAG: phage integrase SAM-like domain-containing protein [Prevotella sp.]
MRIRTDNSRDKREITIRDVFDEYMDYRTRRISTTKLYKYAYRLFVESVGNEDLQLSALVEKDLADFIEFLSARYSGNSAYIIYRIIKSMFNFAERHYYIDTNPCNFVDSRYKLLRCHHHQALNERQMVACEDDFWRWMETERPERVRQILMEARGSRFYHLCFIMGYYLQGLALVDLLLLKIEQIRQRQLAGRLTFIIETNRRKTGKGLKIVIPSDHNRRYRLFSMLYDTALENNKIHLFGFMDEYIVDEQTLYNKVNGISCSLSRKLKQWWRQLNYTVLNDNPIDLMSTSYYSCRHTFATLYLQNPNANLSELAALMGRNTEYIDTYVREIESEKVLSIATDKVYGAKAKSQEEFDRAIILSNQKRIMDMQKLILERLENKIGRR